MLRFAKVIQLISYLYAVLITLGFTVIVNIVTYFALKKIDMIESLKSVEWPWNKNCNISKTKKLGKQILKNNICFLFLWNKIFKLDF